MIFRIRLINIAGNLATSKRTWVVLLGTVRVFHTVRVRYVLYAYGMFSCTIRVWLYRTRLMPFGLKA